MLIVDKLCFNVILGSKGSRKSSGCLAQIIPREVPGVTLGNVGKNRCRLAASEPQWSGIAEPVLLFTTLLKEKMPQIMFQDMLH